MKSSAEASDEIKSVLSPREAGFHPTTVGFIPSVRTDLVKKDQLTSALVFFLV